MLNIKPLHGIITMQRFFFVVFEAYNMKRKFNIFILIVFLISFITYSFVGALDRFGVLALMTINMLLLAVKLMTLFKRS